MEEPTNASIQIPIGGITSICAPGSIDFINSSTNVSENTVFTWEFNDGSPSEVYDHTNLGQTISHLYSAGSTNNCVNHVTLSAENECNTLQGGASTATFTPLRIWDIDQANIQPSSNILCYPDTMVSYTNATVRNCYNQGNISQRYEYWNLGDYWGLGYDSIIDWQPWPPALPIDVHYPGVGTYQVMMIDSSYCGLDTAYTSVQIVDPPIAGLSANEDSICAGESIIFHNLSTGLSNNYIWDFGDSTTSMEANPTHHYQENGIYTILLISYNEHCSDSSFSTITVSNNETIIIPNSFTPNTHNENNGDFDNAIGINDIFYPVIPKAKAYRLDIYNRWGDHLFTSEDQSIGWNGYYKNRLCQTDVYIYKIKVVFLNNKEENYVGQVTLIR